MAARDITVAVFEFGGFVLDPARRSLTLAGAPVILSARALDLLTLLIERRDEVLSKEDLRRLVWRGMAVDDNNLAVQISTLRRALGEGPGAPRFILTVPGRGYQFVAKLAGDRAAPAPILEPAMPFAEALRAEIPARETLAQKPVRPAWRFVWPAAAALLVCAAAAWFWLPRLLPDHGAPRLSIAVLPFRNLSGDAEQDYLADAISDDLTTDLSHIPGSTVIARTSADAFRGHATAAQEIGRTLNVRYLLEGSLRAEGSNLHINAQLIDAPSGSHLWARAFDVERDRLGAARTDIVRNIASALDFTLAEVEGERSLRERHDNPDAEDFYLRARSVLGRANSLAGLTEAQALLEQSIAENPNFVDGLAALGTVLVRRIAEFDDPSEGADHARAQQVISHALSAAPRNPAAITASGYLAWVDGDYAQARVNFQAALSIDRNDVTARQGLVVCARELGRMEEMVAELQILRQIDPASPMNARRLSLIGMGQLFLGKPDEALIWLERAGVGLGDSRLQETTLGWQEWRLIYLIAATEEDGDHASAARQYSAYATLKPHRSVLGLTVYETRAFAATPGHTAYMAALHAAGMPISVGEDEDFAVAAPSGPHEGGDFDPTPKAIPGAAVIGTADLHTRLAGPAKPAILHVGHATAMVPGAIWIWSQGLGDQTRRVLDSVSASHLRPYDTIVVMGDSALGWSGYDAVCQLIAAGFHSVLWYRGGAAAWVSAGFPSEDRRPL